MLASSTKVKLSLHMSTDYQMHIAKVSQLVHANILQPSVRLLHSLFSNTPRTEHDSNDVIQQLDMCFK